MIVVGISGYAGAGKDSVADLLVRDWGFTKMAFATPLKEAVAVLDPILGYHKEYCCAECDAEVEEIRLSTLLGYGLTQEDVKRDFMYGPELRRVYETFGTDVVRAADEDFWVKLASKELFRTERDRIVFSDVRFENEAGMILEAGEIARTIQCSLWRVARPGVTAGEHSSSNLSGLLGEEVTILNDGSLEDLKVPVDMAMRLLLDDQLPGQTAINLDELARDLGLERD